MQQNFSDSGGLLRILRMLPLFTMLFIVSSTSIFAQSLLIHEKNGEETGISFDNIRKIMFSSGNLIVDRSNGINTSFIMTGLRNLQFTENTINTGIDALSASSAGFVLFPNPSNDVLNLRFKQDYQQNYTFDVISFNGKSMLSGVINHVNGSYQIDVKQLPKGLYLFRISDGLHLSSKKFIKN